MKKDVMIVTASCCYGPFQSRIKEENDYGENK